MRCKRTFITGLFIFFISQFTYAQNADNIAEISDKEEGMPRPSTEDKTFQLKIFHTNDIHSAMDLVPKLSAFAESQRQEAVNKGMIPIFDDAGDFYSGSIIHTLAPRSEETYAHINPELEFFRRHGFITTLGNHEWDATQEGLATMIGKLKGARTFPGGILASNMILANPKPKIPNALSAYFFDGIIVLNNELKVIQAYSFSNNNKDIDAVDSHELPQSPLTRGVIKIYKLGNQELKVGFIGVLGPNAIGGSEITRKGTGVSFKKYDSSFVARIVSALRELGAEIIIANCHGGKQPEGVEGPEEDKDLAKNIPGIDLISAGHTHVPYSASEKEAPLIRYQSPAHGQAVVTEIKYSAKKGEIRKLSLIMSKVIYKDDLENAWTSGSDDYKAGAKVSTEEIQSLKTEFDKLIKNDERYIIDAKDHPFLLKHSTVLIEIKPNTIAAKEMGDFSSYESRIPLGKIVMSGVREELNEILLSEKKQPLDVIMTAIELVRHEFPVGRATLFSDIFSMNSRGVMKQNNTLIPDGGKISVLRMTKDDFYRLVGMMEHAARKIEVEATMTYSEGLEFEYNPNGIPIFNNLRNFKLNGRDYTHMPSIVHVGMSSFIAQNIREKAGGIIDQVITHQIDPKDHKMTMDVLLARYLFKNRNLIEEKGVSGSAEQRKNVLKSQIERAKFIKKKKDNSQA